MRTHSNQVKRLWRLAESGDVEVLDPPISAVRKAIEALDGNECNWVSVEVRDGRRMDIGGGRSGEYVCHVRSESRLNKHDLLNPHCQRDMMDLVRIPMGDGEEWSYPRCTVVSLAMVMAAVEYFCTNGEPEPNLTWDDTLKYNIV